MREDNLLMAKLSDERIKKEFGKRFSSAVRLKYEKESLRQIAPLLGVSPAFVGDMMNGLKMPSSDTGVNLAEKLGVTFEWLMTGRGPMIQGKVAVSIDHLSPSAQKAIKNLIKDLENEA